MAPQGRLHGEAEVEPAAELSGHEMGIRCIGIAIRIGSQLAVWPSVASARVVDADFEVVSRWVLEALAPAIEQGFSRNRGLRRHFSSG